MREGAIVMLKSLAARCRQATGRFHIGRRPQTRRVLPIDPRRMAIARLVHLRATGAALLDGVQGRIFGSGLRAWESSVLRWTNGVIEALEAISKDDALWFGTPDILPLISMPMPEAHLRPRDDRDRFADGFYRHAHRLARLRNLLASYGIADAEPAGAEARQAAPS
jgi:hypothetical protein